MYLRDGSCQPAMPGCSGWNSLVPASRWNTRFVHVDREGRAEDMRCIRFHDGSSRNYGAAIRGMTARRTDAPFRRRYVGAYFQRAGNGFIMRD
jgi:hypothetical protein